MLAGISRLEVKVSEFYINALTAARCMLNTILYQAVSQLNTIITVLAEEYDYILLYTYVHMKSVNRSLTVILLMAHTQDVSWLQ